MDAPLHRPKISSALPAAHSRESRLKITFVHRAPTTGRDGRMHIARVPFISMCPTCTQMRPQPEYDRNTLLRLLRGGYPLEAYCSMCDEFWSISARERATLVAEAVASGAGIVC